jgi:ribosome-associated protein
MATGMRFACVLPLEYLSCMLTITATIQISENELEESFIRSPGPGGQKVNKTATAVQLRFDAFRSPSLTDEILQRLKEIAGARMTDEGQIIIEAKRFRTRERNRRDARERLVRLLRMACVPPKTRKAGRPTSASRLKRLESKRRTSLLKKSRGMRNHWRNEQ